MGKTKRYSVNPIGENWNYQSVHLILINCFSPLTELYHLSTSHCNNNWRVFREIRIDGGMESFDENA